MTKHRHSSRHPTSACIDFMRRTLAEDVSDLDIILDVSAPAIQRLHRQYRSITNDSGVHFPTSDMFKRENWGGWQDAIRQQVANASRGQIAEYFAERYGVRSASDCPVCQGD